MKPRMLYVLCRRSHWPGRFLIERLRYDLQYTYKLYEDMRELVNVRTKAWLTSLGLILQAPDRQRAGRRHVGATSAETCTTTLVVL